MRTCRVHGRMQRVVRTLRQSAIQDCHTLSDGDLLERYLVQADEAAFATLVRRHGPMVLAVCRRILRDPHDADDAFQATFLVLVRRAESIRPREQVGPWLYGVAYRTSTKANAMNLRRRAKQQTLQDVPGPAPPAPDDWLALLDRELHRLPDKYRLPIVLCDLEGKTRKQAARQLGWPEGTVATRLQHGRTLVQKRLLRHGLPTVAGAASLAWAEAFAAAAVPAALVAATLKTASLWSAGKVAGAVSLKVLALTEGVLHAMILSKMKNLSVLVILVCLIGLGASGLSGSLRSAAGAQAPPPPAQPTFERAPAPKPPPTAEQAHEKPDGRLPTGPALVQVLASLDKDHVVIRAVAPAYVPRQYYDSTGRSVTTYYEPIQTLQATRYAASEIDVFDTQRRKLDKNDISKWLKEEVPALMIVGTKTIDPLHLRLIKDGTLIFAVPSQPVPTVINTQATPVDGVPAAPVYVPPPYPVAPSPANASPPLPRQAPAYSGVPLTPPTVPAITPATTPDTAPGYGRSDQAARQFAIAEHYLKTGHSASAEFYFDIVRQRFPGTPYAEKAQRWLDDLRRSESKPPPADQGKLRVGEIIIVGSDRVPDALILGGLGLYPGQAFQEKDVSAAVERLRRLDALINPTPLVEIQIHLQALTSGRNSRYKDILITLQESLRLDVLAEVQNLEGTWTVTGVSHDGKMMPFKENREMIFVGNEIITRAGNSTGRSAYSLRLAGKTKSIRIGPLDGADTRQASVGTYELQGDRLKLMMSSETKPGQSESQPVVEFTLRRKRAADSFASEPDTRIAPKTDVPAKTLEINVTVKGISICAENLSIEPDGSLKLTNATVTRLDKGTPGAGSVLRGQMILIHFDGPIRTLADLQKREMQSFQVDGGKATLNNP